MLARYKIPYLKKLPPTDPASKGVRIDTRKHTRSCLRPSDAMVQRYLSDPNDENWERFAKEYRALLDRRYREDRAAFDELYRRAKEADVFLGCSCPTNANPDVYRCHTVIALSFMQEKYPDLEVVFPAFSQGAP